MGLSASKTKCYFFEKRNLLDLDHHDLSLSWNRAALQFWPLPRSFPGVISAGESSVHAQQTSDACLPMKCPGAFSAPFAPAAIPLTWSAAVALG